MADKPVRVRFYVSPDLVRGGWSVRRVAPGSDDHQLNRPTKRIALAEAKAQAEREELASVYCKKKKGGRFCLAWRFCFRRS
jgi:hypothetical protein